MSRTTFTALAVLLILAFAGHARAEWWNTAGRPVIRPVTWDDPQEGVVDLAEPDKPTYDELLEQIDTLQGQLDAAYEMAERYGTDEELQEFREAVGWDLGDYDLSDYGHTREGSTGGPGGDMGDMATQSQNPVGGLWMMWLQNDMKLMEGPLGGKRIFDTVVFQPVMPVQLTDTWKVINRPVFMFNAFETPSPFNFRPGGSQDPAPPGAPFNTQAGLGDIAFIQWLSNSPSSSRMVTGVGWCRFRYDDAGLRQDADSVGCGTSVLRQSRRKSQPSVRSRVELPPIRFTHHEGPAVGHTGFARRR
jgi:hypothetical protein